MHFRRTAASALGAALLTGGTAAAQPPRPADDARIAAADHHVAINDHIGYVRRPPPNRELVRVGADTLSDRPLGKKKDQAGEQIPLLSERLDGCLWPDDAVDKFACVARSTRTAARSYRRLAGVRQWETDAFTAGSAAGLTVVAIGVGHAAKDSLNAWSAVGLLPLIADDLASPGPRARLYNVAAIAMTMTVVRAESQHAALSAVTERMRGRDDQLGDLQQRVRSACDPAAFDPAKVRPNLKDDAKKAAEKLSATVSARCDDLTTAARKLVNAASIWSFGGDQASRSLAADTAILDDTIARLDRSMRATSKETLSVVLKAPFNLASNLVGGQTAPPEYTGRNLPVFTSTYSLNLGRVPDAEVPAALGAALEAPVAPADWRPRVRVVNALTDEINAAIAAATYFKGENERSVLAISPGNNPPVTLSTPSRP
ncbi:hypothetical protein [Phenylobacterium sp.]|uniref:hypothetical protein n=1 Tax=Phenylobacterium sp. TaxID=1871053 RepID=UPI0030F38060